MLEEALALYRLLGDERSVARMLANLGSVAIHEGDHQRAIALYEETMPLFRAAGDDRALAVTLSNLASMAKAAGDDARARELGEEGLAVALRTGDKESASISLHNLGRAALREERLDDAAARLSGTGCGRHASSARPKGCSMRSGCLSAPTSERGTRRRWSCCGSRWEQRLSPMRTRRAGPCRRKPPWPTRSSRPGREATPPRPPRTEPHGRETQTESGAVSDAGACVAATAARGRVASTEPARTSAKPTAMPRVKRSSRIATPSTAATAGFT